MSNARYEQDGAAGRARRFGSVSWRPMDAPTYRLARSDDELEQILALQRRNLEEVLAPGAARREGFVTVRHDLALLRDMNDAAPHVVAIGEERVVGYALVMLRSFAERIPLLAPMFALLDELLGDRRWLVMGQVCVDVGWRGRGVLDGLYRELRLRYEDRYDLVATEIARRNGRSSRAHARVGFELLHRHRAEGGEEWDVVVWTWR